MRPYAIAALLATCALILAACGPAEFSGNGSNKATSEAGAADGSVAQTGADDANGAVPETDDDDDANGAVPQISVADFLGLLPQDPATQAIVKENRCYISHGGGHGIDVCLAGDKTEILKLWPIEVRGDQLCVPVDTLRSKADLFKGGMIGRCAGQ